MSWPRYFCTNKPHIDYILPLKVRGSGNYDAWCMYIIRVCVLWLGLFLPVSALLCVSFCLCFYVSMHLWICLCLSVAGAAGASDQLWRRLNSIFHHSNCLPNVSEWKAAFWLARSPLPIRVQVLSVYLSVQAGFPTGKTASIALSPVSFPVVCGSGATVSTSQG